MMRLLSGLTVLFGTFDHSVPVHDGHTDDVADDHSGDLEELDGDGPDMRWVPTPASAVGMAGVAIGILSFSFDGHTVSKGPRIIHAIVNAVHVSAGSIWFGGPVALVVVGILRRSAGRPTGPLIVRFSQIATHALIIVTLAGALMTLFVMDSLGDLTRTDWGRLLLVKVGVVGIAASMGAYHHFVVVPSLDNAGVVASMEARARTTIAVEASCLVLVVVLTVFLTSASTN
jgi:copper transport protein